MDNIFDKQLFVGQINHALSEEEKAVFYAKIDLRGQDWFSKKVCS